VFSSCAAERSGPTGAAARAAKRLPLEICRPAGLEEDVLCGTLSVPENRQEPGGRTIELAIVVVPALAAEPESEPWFDFEGGPGDSATDLAFDYTDDLATFRQVRDVVLVDQRGVGGSGLLDCAELDRPEDPLMERFELEAVLSCRDRLVRQHDLTRYTTTEAVHDFEAVRSHLGYERVHLFGYSYGTLVAQEYARLHPEMPSGLSTCSPIAAARRQVAPSAIPHGADS
jgi:pimeloyl-ACP methyl ester carboxylesterase